MQGKIIKQISNDYTVSSGNKEYICKARGKFRKMEISPLVGDEVIFDEHENIIGFKPHKSAEYVSFKVQIDSSGVSLDV